MKRLALELCEVSKPKGHPCRSSATRWSMVAVGKANDLAEVVGARNQWHGKPHYLQRCPRA